MSASSSSASHTTYTAVVRQNTLTGDQTLTRVTENKPLTKKEAKNKLNAQKAALRETHAMVRALQKSTPPTFRRKYLVDADRIECTYTATKCMESLDVKKTDTWSEVTYE